MTKLDDLPRVPVSTSAALRDWLAEHHGAQGSVWLVTWKKTRPERYVSREAVLDELLCFGWIDGVRRKLDEERPMQLISPRKVQHWTATYKARAQRLIEEGRMAAPGLASIEAGKRSGLWTFMDAPSSSTSRCGRKPSAITR